ncbi:hypothetical protein GWI33_013114 [Rhynchophorus ferrugineus]|uniref:Uncharacterized protein n=1 Tax=Rhynchophorus ferrugineus TaxID=354439 RepID=A0A834IAD0_RHYFE|nr:hypothetical protein GWI33_013114 [Rhynchophorus ferrugineus]
MAREVAEEGTAAGREGCCRWCGGGGGGERGQEHGRRRRINRGAAPRFPDCKKSSVCVRALQAGGVEEQGRREGLGVYAIDSVLILFLGGSASPSSSDCGERPLSIVRFMLRRCYLGIISV